MVVDRTVAIIIETVAGFTHWKLLFETPCPTSIRTVAQTFVTFSSVRSTVRTGPTRNRFNLICLTVTVVIETVADLLSRSDFWETFRSSAVGADDGAALTLAYINATREHLTIEARTALVDLSVAVVIDEVAAQLRQVRIEEAAIAWVT